MELDFFAGQFRASDFFRSSSLTSPQPVTYVADDLGDRSNNREWVVILMGKGFQGFHMLTDRVPGWLLMIVTSMLGTSLMQWLHKSTPKSKIIRTTNTSSTEGSSKQSLSHPSSDPVASRELKKELADASVQLAQLTAQKRGASSKTQSTTTQRRK
jgi:hypothetical protein